MNERQISVRTVIVPLIFLFFITLISSLTPRVDALELVIVTWNVRGCPEKKPERIEWFSEQLTILDADILCIQEIANQDSVDRFLEIESIYTKVGFLNSSDGQDNAIFAVDLIELEDIDDPEGFQHPAQAVYIAYGGFDAVIVTVHLSWTNLEMREQEKLALQTVVESMLQRDPDVIIVGDFNTKEEGIQDLADDLGLEVMTPADQDGVGTTHSIKNNRYDHFLISPDLAEEEAVMCRIVTYSGEDLLLAKKTSDHLPVVAWFRISEHFRDR